MAINIGINGFGRIGRCILSSIIESGRTDVKIKAINATGPLETIVHLLKYDSVHGKFPKDISFGEGYIDCGTGPIRIFSTYNPKELNWTDVDVVLECTGKFNSKKDTLVHLEQGAKKVLISAPAENADKTIVFGVNENSLTAEDKIISNGSCTTNCLAPIAKILNNSIGIDHGIMTTIHSYTADQSILDKRHKDLYRSRAAALSMIPTSTGAAKAIGAVIPDLEGKLDGSAIRVPTPNVSAVDLTFIAQKITSIEEVNSIVKAASLTALGRIVSYDAEPKVSIDFNHSSFSSIFAPDQTKVVGKKLVRILAWYDNEWGFSCRMVDIAKIMGTI
ncbi:MAG: type I glyceraldehyde-3-phosphate dehydrogenase [Paracoccaceae bacterium]